MEGLNDTPKSATEKLPPAELQANVTNPHEVVSSFLNSPGFQEKLTQRRTAAQEKSPDVTEEEVTQALLGTGAVAELFYRHAQRQGFKFEASEYSPEAQKKIEEYWRTIRDLQKDRTRRSWDAGDIEYWNAQKRQSHAKAAQQLVKDGVAPTFTIARELVAVLTENKGLDKRSSADSRIRSAVPYYRRTA